MNSLKITVLSALALVFVACDSNEVQMVKGGTLQSCPDKTVEQMVNGYMGNPEWRSLVAEDGNDYVNVVGEISYNNQPTKAEIQFRLNKEKSSFQFQAWELGGKPAPDIVAAVLLEKMCYADLENLAKDLVEAQLSMEKMEQDGTFASVMESEGKEIAEKCKHFVESGENSEFQGLYKAMSCMEEKTTNQELKNKIQSLKGIFEVMQKVESLPEKRRKMVEKYAIDDPRMAKQKAKSEASVIGPAMGTFRKMLDAYVAETESLNTWKRIGFESPNSSKFSFEQITLLDDFIGAFVVIEGVKATNLVKLSDCPALSSWIMQCGLDKEKKVICECSIKSSNKEACESITPNFKKMCE